MTTVATALLCALVLAAAEPAPEPAAVAAPEAPAEAVAPAAAEATTAAGSFAPGLAPAPAAEPAKDEGWLQGDHLSTEWGGGRGFLDEHGVTIDLVYSSELFSNLTRVTRGGSGTNLLGHVDAALTVDTGKLGLWKGGKFYVLGQNNHLYTPTHDPEASGANEFVGSSQPVSNLEVKPMSQLGELFYEQALVDDKLKLRFGKQDANRDFGTPRYGGNFLNNNFGMFPNSPLPSFPTNGLGGVAVVEPAPGIVARVGVYEGQPQIGSYGLDSARAPGAGVSVIVGGSYKHTYGVDRRNGGNTSVGLWRQTGDFADLRDEASPHFVSAVGFFVQNDEKLFNAPADKDSYAGWNLITRVSWAQPDRYLNGLFVSASLAYHGLGPREDDTVGLGGGFMTVGQQLLGAPGAGNELFVEAFYKARLTKFFSVQPDLTFYRHPGGDGQNAFVPGVRLKFKL